MYRDQQRWDDLGSCLRLAAWIECRLGNTEPSAVLLGASLRWTDHLDFQDSLLLPEVAVIGDNLEAGLGAETFREATARGASMDFDELATLLETNSDRALTGSAAPRH
jgi:hypothetical protein